MSDKPWMPFNVGDYLKNTRHLTTLEHGAYMLLIMQYWEDGGLPENEAMIARYAGLTPAQWAESRDVLAAFFEAGWKHKRIEDEIAKATAKIEQRKNARQGDGSATAARRKPDGKATGDAPPRGEEPITVSSSLRSDEKTRAARLPENWSLPDEWRQDALDAGLPADRIDFEAARIRDWSRSSAGSVGAKRDWRAAWRNWCKRVVDEMPRARGSPPKVTMLDVGKQLLQKMQAADAVPTGQAQGNQQAPLRLPAG